MIFLLTGEYLPSLALKIATDRLGTSKSRAFQKFCRQFREAATWVPDPSAPPEPPAWSCRDSWVCSCPAYRRHCYRICHHLCQGLEVVANVMATQIHGEAPFLGPARLRRPPNLQNGPVAPDAQSFRVAAPVDSVAASLNKRDYIIRESEAAMLMFQGVVIRMRNTDCLTEDEQREVRRTEEDLRPWFTLRRNTEAPLRGRRLPRLAEHNAITLRRDLP